MPNAYAANSNIIDKNLIPLCIENEGFSTRCTCKAQGNCGDEISNVKLKSSLFRIEGLRSTTATQLKYAKKMAYGKMAPKDYDSLERELVASHKLINPEIAADNFDKNLLDFGYPAFNIKQNAKNLLASLQKDALQKINTKSKIKFDPTKINFEKNKTEVPTDVIAEKNNEGNQETKEVSEEMETKERTIKAVKNKEDLDDFKLDFKDINENEDVNIFKIITNRYRAHFSDFKL
jgi:hypothetical protein